MPMPSFLSKFAGTAVLAFSLLSLQGALWYFRPKPTGNVPQRTGNVAHRYSAVNTYGGNRKLLDVNSSRPLLSSGHLRHDPHERTNHHRNVSCTVELHFSVQMDISLY